MFLNKENPGSVRSLLAASLASGLILCAIVFLLFFPSTFSSPIEGDPIELLDHLDRCSIQSPLFPSPALPPGEGGWEVLFEEEFLHPELTGWNLLTMKDEKEFLSGDSLPSIKSEGLASTGTEGRGLRFLRIRQPRELKFLDVQRYIEARGGSTYRLSGTVADRGGHGRLYAAELNIFRKGADLILNPAESAARIGAFHEAAPTGTLTEDWKRVGATFTTRKDTRTLILGNLVRASREGEGETLFTNILLEEKIPSPAEAWEGIRKRYEEASLPSGWQCAAFRRVEFKEGENRLRLREVFLAPPSTKLQARVHLPEDSSVELEYGFLMEERQGKPRSIQVVLGLEQGLQLQRILKSSREASLQRLKTPPLSKPGPGTFTLEIQFSGEFCWFFLSSIRIQSPSPPLPEENPPVVLISVDTLRADRLACYGYDKPTSPHIDELARDGILFLKGLNPAPWTLPSYASLFTSLYPSFHGAGIVSEKGMTPVSPDCSTLAESFRNHGYLTAGIVNNTYFLPSLGLHRGFCDFTLFDILDRFSFSGGDITRAALAWMRDHFQKKFFLFLHYMDPHLPYAPPPDYRKTFLDPSYAGPVGESVPDLETLKSRNLRESDRKRVSSLYDAEVAYTDGEVGKILQEMKKLGIYDRAVICFHGDHGEEFWDHEGVEHGHSLYSEILQMPFILKLPQSRFAGKRFSMWVRAIDIMPTLLAASRISLPEQADGIDLLSILEGKEGERILPSFGESILYGKEKKSVQVGRYKYILQVEDGQEELYDLEADPGEKENLVSVLPGLSKALRGRVESFQKEAAGGKAYRKGKAVPLDEETLRQLKALGYFREH